MGVTEPTRADWLAARRHSIGASEWAMVLGLSSYKSRYQLACEKLGLIDPEPLEATEDMEYGLEMEAVTLRRLAKVTGRAVVPCDQNRSVYSAERPYLSCTPDAIQHDAARGKSTAQAKNTNHFRAADWKEQPPLAYQIQLQAEMYVCGYDWGTLCATIGGCRFKHFDIERNDKFINAALPVLERFWSDLQAGKLPEVDGSASTTMAIEARYEHATTVPGFTLDDTYLARFADLTAIKAALAALEEHRRAIENDIKAALGEVDVAMLSDGSSFSWKEQERTLRCQHCAGIVQHSNFRVLRQHKPRKGKQETIADRRAIVTAALISRGATLYAESESGSRYFDMAGGLRIRVADHEANEKTDAWMQRNEVAEVRLDAEDWRGQLEAITGPTLLEHTV